MTDAVEIMTNPRLEPKVSVCVITYNQEAFIGECLQSIVDQETDFDFEVVVGDDASTDGTADVVREFETRYPNRVRAIYQCENIGGGARNFRLVHLAAAGEYIAHVDGDDVLLPGKLQSQVAILDANPHISYAAHAVKVIGSSRVIGDHPKYPEIGSVYDLLRLGTYFTHSSVMYRRSTGSVLKLPELCIDYYMHIARAMHGDLYLDKRVLGLYRTNVGGISQSSSNRNNMERYFEEAFDFAAEAGLDPSVVAEARFDRRMKFAIARYLEGDIVGYRRLIHLRSEEIRNAGKRHRMLSRLRRWPAVVGVYFHLQKLRVRIWRF